MTLRRLRHEPDPQLIAARAQIHPLRLLDGKITDETRRRIARPLVWRKQALANREYPPSRLWISPVLRHSQIDLDHPS